jgi:hypothetical protein
MKGAIEMQKERVAAIAAALTITWICGCSIHPVLTENTKANVAAAMPVGKAASATTGTSESGAAVSGGATATRQAVKPGNYAVRTIWKNTPLPNVRVEWRRQAGDTAPALVADTMRIGTANFSPPSGSYFLTADWRQDGDFARPRKPGDRFAWYGGNPLLVSSETSEVVTLILEAVPSAPVSIVKPAGTGIFGRVTLDGIPAADVGVYAYAKTGSGFKSDDFQATVRTNAKGEFSIELPPDRYYLVARLRSDNSVSIGPPHKGDLFGYDPGNPIVVAYGSYAASAIPVARLRMEKSRIESSAFPPGRFEGLIVDRDDRPVSGAYVALYQTAKMAGRPIFLSDLTGDDGLFKLSVPVPGTYFLCARSGYGTPKEGSWFGAWGGSTNHSIQIKPGEVRAEIKIVVDRLKQDIPVRNP